MFEPPQCLPIPVRLNRTIESFHYSECWGMFRFRKWDLMRLKIALRIPDVVVYQGSKFTGEEVLLAGLYRLKSPENLCNITKTFGREYSQ
jgi:hypothetical protein